MFFFELSKGEKRIGTCIIKEYDSYLVATHNDEFPTNSFYFLSYYYCPTKLYYHNVYKGELHIKHEHFNKETKEASTCLKI